MSGRTGKLRYKIVNIKGVFGSEPVVIVQSEIQYIYTTNLGGCIDSEWRYKWVNTEPEWLMGEPSHKTYESIDPFKVLR
jgi:hypothetical protein